jgi:hypothetical protein
MLGTVATLHIVATDLTELSSTGDNIFNVYLTEANQPTRVSGSLIPAGVDQNDVKTGTIQLFVPRKGNYSLNIIERKRGLDMVTGIPIYAAERMVEVDVLAGGAAGLITLLGIIGATALFTDGALQANEQTMITLAVSTFITGFIPFR